MNTFVRRGLVGFRGTCRGSASSWRLRRANRADSARQPRSRAFLGRFPETYEPRRTTYHLLVFQSGTNWTMPDRWAVGLQHRHVFRRAASLRAAGPRSSGTAPGAGRLRDHRDDVESFSSRASSEGTANSGVPKKIRALRARPPAPRHVLQVPGLSLARLLPFGEEQSRFTALR